MSEAARETEDALSPRKLLIGGGGFLALMTLLYLVSWFSSDGDLQLTRSNITIMAALYGMLITWHVQGIDIYQPRSFLRHWRILLMSSLLTAGTILVMYADPLFEPAIFEFKPPQWDGGAGSWMILAIPALFLLTLVLSAHGLKYRYLLERFWELLAPDRG